MVALPSLNKTRKGRLVFALHDDSFAYVHAYTHAGDTRISHCGVIARPKGDDAAGLARRVRALDLPAAPATAMLSLAACQLLQIEAPAVPPEELKAAARWKIKGLIDAPLDDTTIDVMHVGDGRAKAKGQLFVAATATRDVRSIADSADAARITLAAIDIREMAQRNLQTAVARAHGANERANAALVVHGNTCLLTLAARGELFYARRLEWDPRVLEAPTAATLDVDPSAPITDYAELDMVDYGATDNTTWTGAHDDVAPIVLEMQRSIDVWDRSWPDLPLERLVVHAQDHTEALVALLAATLPLPVRALDLDALFPGLDAACASPQVRNAVAPLLGALLRD